MARKVLGVIGGSGLYDIGELKDVEKVSLNTPFGEPSDDFVVGRIADTKVVFLARHGVGHRIQPSDINYRANIYGMKKLGVEWILSVSAVGSMKEEIAPGHLVVVDQFYDNTKHRASTFFGNGVVGHVSLADPVCPNFAGAVYKTAEDLNYRTHKGGTYICIEGPQFSTRAESKVYRAWGVSVIGMTNISEVKLAREAEICYSTLALATDYDCWHESEEDVTADMVVQVINKNVRAAKDVIINLASRLPERACTCKEALKYAVVTNPDKISTKIKKDLEPIIGKYIK